jgi:hypothetical protein
MSGAHAGSHNYKKPAETRMGEQESFEDLPLTRFPIRTVFNRQDGRGPAGKLRAIPPL